MYESVQNLSKLTTFLINRAFSYKYVNYFLRKKGRLLPDYFFKKQFTPSKKNIVHKIKLNQIKQAY